MKEQMSECVEYKEAGDKFAENYMEVTQQDIHRAVRALSPHIQKTSLRLAEKAMRRRALHLQAWALAGCSMLFVALIGVVWQNKAFIMEKMTEFRVLAIFGVFVLLLLACLPVIIKKREGEN